MFTLTVTEKGGATKNREFDQPEVTIGRVQGNDIVLPKSNISKRHARIIYNGGSFVVIDSKSTNGTYINGKRIDAPYDVVDGDKIFVGDFTLEIDMGEAEQEEAPRKAAPPPPPSEKPGRKSRSSDSFGDSDLLSDEEWGAEDAEADAWDEDWAPDPGTSTSASDPEVEAALDTKGKPAPKKKQRPAPAPKAKSKSSSAPKSRSKKKPAPEPAPERSAPKSRPSKKKSPTAPLPDESSAALRTVHERLLDSLDLRRMNVEHMSDEELRSQTRDAVEEIVHAMESAGELPRGTNSGALTEQVLDEALGLGPLEDLLADDSISEIMVNGSQTIFVERDGRIEATDRSFSSDQAVLGVIERIVAPLGRRVDESSPMVDARLKDGSRVNAIIPPLALEGPTLTIRKFRRDPLLIDDLVMSSTLTADMAEFLDTCVLARKNILISGGTGSGKTTTLNGLSGYLPADERIITIEDAAELALEQAHVIRLEARPPNIEGRGEVAIRDLVRNALRMRPDRIVVGECRGGEALDMLQAMNTGHDGSLTTIHANGPRDALARLETLVLMSGMDLPVRAIRDQIASAINIVVQQTRFPDGSRKITHISEVTGMESDVISMQDIFTFEQEGFDEGGKVVGAFRPTGVVPRFYETLASLGIETDMNIFQD